jgi:hypothetical protein
MDDEDELWQFQFGSFVMSAMDLNWFFKCVVNLWPFYLYCNELELLWTCGCDLWTYGIFICLVMNWTRTTVDGVPGCGLVICELELLYVMWFVNWTWWIDGALVLTAAVLNYCWLLLPGSCWLLHWMLVLFFFWQQMLVLLCKCAVSQCATSKSARQVDSNRAGAGQPSASVGVFCMYWCGWWRGASVSLCDRILLYWNAWNVCVIPVYGPASRPFPL